MAFSGRHMGQCLGYLETDAAYLHPQKGRHLYVPCIHRALYPSKDVSEGPKTLLMYELYPGRL